MPSTSEARLIATFRAEVAFELRQEAKRKRKARIADAAEAAFWRWQQARSAAPQTVAARAPQWCSQCDRRVAAQEATACSSPFCKLKDYDHDR